ncbi:hypothetical protein A5784_25750 [Mycobacterium sp. 852013-50091_SCH5140682]|nr:hypothetical protein A5784_25750 [Mycobacterium sp. 852013-50091_SCH5140682]
MHAFVTDLGDHLTMRFPECRQAGNVSAESPFVPLVGQPLHKRDSEKRLALGAVGQSIDLLDRSWEIGQRTPHHMLPGAYQAVGPDRWD